MDVRLMEMDGTVLPSREYAFIGELEERCFGSVFRAVCYIGVRGSKFRVHTT